MRRIFLNSLFRGICAPKVTQASCLTSRAGFQPGKHVPALKRAEMPGDDVTGLDVARIGRRALHGCLYDIWRFDFEVGFYHCPNRVVEQSEFVLFPAVKIRVPMPGRMPARALCAEHEEIGIRRPRRMDHAAALVAFGRSKIARRNQFADVSRISTRDSLSGGGNFPTST